MLMLAGTFRVPPEKLGEAEPHMAAVIEASGREEGCLYFAFGYDVLEPGLVNVMELWRDQAALDAHRETAHFLAWKSVREAIGMHDRRLSLYEIASATPQP